MSARTSADVYRPLCAPLRRRRLRFLPLAAAGLRASCRKKLPLVVLYGPVAIATVIFSFVVYGKYAALAGLRSRSMEGIGGLAALMADRAARNLEVRRMVVEFDQSMRVFALLAVAWFATGLVADDLRLGAHRLYFSRPLTRLDYVLGKLLVAMSFGALGLLAPGLVILLVAAWSSPDWSFLREEGDVVVATVLYAAVWIPTVSLLALAASSLARRKVLALAGLFAFVFVGHAFGRAVGVLQEDARFSAFSLHMSMRRIGEQLFDAPSTWTALAFDVRLAWASVIGTAVLAAMVLAWRLRRVEVVA